MSGTRQAAVELTGDPRKLDGVLATSNRKVAKWGQKVAADIKGAMRGAFSGLAGVAGFGGLAAITLATKNVFEFETRLARLQVASRSTAAGMEALKDQIFSVAGARGVDKDQLLGGVETFVALTGDMKGAAAAMDVFAKVSAATGADLEEVSRAAAGLRTNMKITSAGELESALATLAMQGKAGAVELKEISQLVAGLTPRFAMFNNTGAAGVAEMGALLQIMQRGFGSASEASTGFNSLMGTLLKKQKEIRRLGVKMFDIGPDGVRRMRSVSDIVFQIAAKTKGDPIKVQQLLTDKESIQAFAMVASAGKAEFDSLVGAMQGAKAELDQDFGTMKNTPAFKMKQAKAQIDKTFNDLLARNLTTIAAAFQKIADVIKFIADHPIAVGAALAVFKGGGYMRGLGALGGGGGGVAAAAAGLGGDLLPAARAANTGLAGFASKLGIAMPILAAGIIGINAAFDYLNSQIDEKEQKLASDLNVSHYGELGVQNARAVLAGEGEASMFNKGREVLIEEEAASGRRALLGEAMRAGKIQRSASGEYEQVSKEGGLVGADANLSYEQLEEIARATKIAMDEANAAIAAGGAGAPARAGGSPIVVRVEVGVDPVTGNLTAEDAMKKLTKKRRRGKR